MDSSTADTRRRRAHSHRTSASPTELRQDSTARPNRIARSVDDAGSPSAGWALRFELAPADRVGAHQGVYGTGYAVAAMIAPTVVTLTAIDLGTVGWGILAVVFLGAALGVGAIAGRAARTTIAA